MVLNSSLHFKINFESVKKLCWHFAIFSNRMLRQKEMMVGDCQLATVISKTASWYLFLVTVIRLVQVYLNVSEGLHRLCWAPNVGITSTEPSSHSSTPPSLEKPCQPDQDFTFSEIYFGKEKRWFQWHWFERYPFSGKYVCIFIYIILWNSSYRKREYDLKNIVVISSCVTSVLCGWFLISVE